MALKQDIVVTGLGVVSPLGVGKEPFWTALCEGQSGIRRLDWLDDPALPPMIGGTVADFDPKQYVRPRKSLKVMSRDIQLAFAAADLACVDAGLRERPVAPERLGVAFGAGMIPGELDEFVGTYRGCMVDGQFRFPPLGSDGDGRIVPALDVEISAQHAGLPHRHRPGRPGTEQLDHDGRRVESLGAGRGGADSRARTGRRPDRRRRRRAAASGALGPERYAGAFAACRQSGGCLAPFDGQRDGLVNGEGAAAFLLETRPHAQARGVPILARILGYAATFERTGRFLGEKSYSACEMPAERCGGGAIRRAIVGALRDAGLTPAELGCVVAHGVSTIDDDRIEAQAIREVLGNVPVTAAKGNFGYLGAASGARGGHERVDVSERVHSADT